MYRRIPGALTDPAKHLSVASSSRLSYFALETHFGKLTTYIEIYEMANAEHSVFAETQQFFIKQR